MIAVHLEPLELDYIEGELSESAGFPRIRAWPAHRGEAWRASSMRHLPLGLAAPAYAVPRARAN